MKEILLNAHFVTAYTSYYNQHNIKSKYIRAVVYIYKKNMLTKSPGRLLDRNGRQHRVIKTTEIIEKATLFYFQLNCIL